jgi:hypothetical protein
MRDGDIDTLSSERLQELWDRRTGQNVIELRRTPRWIERMQERGLPDKDYTRFTPQGPDAA